MEPNESANEDTADTARQGLSPAVITAVNVVEQLIRSGVREAVVCPGSRSAPLALSFAEAERTGRLRLHVRTDERTGAFLALGLAKATRRAVPIVTTSGTAVANCLPAMVEATLSNVPLMVISANRPLHMVGSGANQTIDQVGIFGAHAVGVFSTVEGEDSPSTAKTGTASPAEEEVPSTASGVSSAEKDAVRDVVRRAVDAATDPDRGGGVQLDVPLVEPLVPPSMDQLSLYAQDCAADPETAAAGDTAAAPHEGSGALAETKLSPASPGAAAPHVAAPLHPGPRTFPHGQVTVDLSQRTLVIAGSAADEAWARSIRDELADIPTIAEPMAPAPGFPVHSAAAAMFTADAVTQGEYSALTRPEQIIVVGRPTLHRPVMGLIQDPQIKVTILSDTDSVLNLADNVEQVGSTIKLEGEHPHGWTKVCEAISDMGAEAIRDVLTSSADEHFTGLHAAAVVADSLRDGDAFVLGASNSIRDASRSGLPFDGVRTVASRGAAGIDGTLSTAVGIAMAHAAADPTAIRAPRTVALVGDLTFMHDATALNIGPLERHPDNLLIVVVNDAGGAIFETLEPGAEHLREFGDGTPAFERVFGTPLTVDFAALCDSFGVNYLSATTVAELADILADHAEEPAVGITVVEARVERGWRREMEEQIKHVVAPS